MGFRVKTAVVALCLAFAAASAADAGLQPLFEQGIEAFRAGNYGSSELLFRKIIDSGENGEFRDRTWYYLALSIFNQKKYKAAIFEFNRFLLICTAQDLCTESRYWIAESYFYLRDYIRSIEEHKRFIAQSKNELLIVSAHDRIAEIYFQQGRFDEAILELRESINFSTNVLQNNQRVLRIGEALYLNESYDEALQLMESLLASKSEIRVESKARMIIGRIDQLKNRHREALKALYGIPMTVLKEEPFYDVQYLKAVSSIALGDNYSAKSFLESFLLIGKNSEYYYDAKYELGKILIKENDEKAGSELLEEVRNSTRKMSLRSRAALILSRIYLKRNPEEAIPYLEDAVSLEEPEEQKNALLLLSRVYADVKRYEDAERILGVLVSTYPYDSDNDLIQFLMARVALEKGEIEKAMEGFRKLQSAAVSSAYAQESYYYLARAHMALGQNEKAMEFLIKYMTLARVEKKYDAGVTLSRLYLEAGDTANAEKSMWTVINNFRGQEGLEAAVYEFSKALLERKGDPRRYFQFIVNNFPRSESAGEVLIAWGDEAFRRKEYAAAEWHYRLYLTVETRRNVASVFLYRVMALFHLNRFRDIISLADEIKELNADDYTRRQVSLWLGRSYYRTGNPELAYKTLFTGKLGDLEPDDLIILARCALEIGDIWTAQAVPALLANDKERYGESLFILGQYHAPDNPQAAMDFFTKVITDCPDSGFADPARMELSELFVKNRRFAEAVANLDEIKDEKLLDRRNALLIISFFRTGKIQRAIELTRKNIPKLLGLPHGEAVVKENLFYYFLNRDVENFTLYSGYMGRYPGTGALVNYLSGKLYFEVGRYSTSYYYFYKLTHAESEYKDEALYNLAVISLYDQKNRNLAIAYFKKLAESADTGNAVVLKAKMNLAILLNEKGDIPASRNTLKEISEGPENVVIKTQAENLWNYFGYTK